MIVIRPAEIVDLEALRALAIETCVHTFGEFNSSENMNHFLEECYGWEIMRQEWNAKGTAYFLAWENQMLTGFSRLRLNDEVTKELGDNTIEIQRLYVHPDHQGKKIGSILMQHALDFASARRHEWIWLGVWERNFKAQAFYERWGFKRFSEHVFPMGDDPQIDWLLKRRLG